MMLSQSPPPAQQDIHERKTFWGRRAIGLLLGSAAGVFVGCAEGHHNRLEAALVLFATSVFTIIRFWQAWSQHSLWSQDSCKTVEKRRSEAKNKGMSHMLDQEWTNPQDPFAYSKVLTVAEKNASYCKHFQDTNFSYEIAASSRMPYSKANHLSNTILKSPLSQRVQGYASLSDADKAKIATQTRAFQDKLEAYGMTIQDQQSKEQWNHFIAAMAKEPEPSQKEQHKESQEKKEQRDQWNGAVATGSLAFSLYNSYNTNNALNTLFDELKTLHAQAYAALTAQ